MKKFWRFAPSAAFFVQFLLEIEKNFSALRHLKGFFIEGRLQIPTFFGALHRLQNVMQIVSDVSVKKQGRNCHIFLSVGEELEILSKLFTLVEMAFPFSVPVLLILLSPITT